MNEHGLTRKIPPRVKLAVRKNSGFGCVICAESLCEYEHVDPEFKDAIEHKAEGIALLCPTCHSKKTRKFISSETVKEAMSSPKAFELGTATSSFETESRELKILLGEGYISAKGEITLFEIQGEKIISVVAPGYDEGTVQINVKIYDQEQLVFQIEKNTWLVRPTSGDFEAVGGRLIVRDKGKKEILNFDISEPGTLKINNLDIFYRGCNLVCDPEKRSCTIKYPNGHLSGFTGLDHIIQESGVFKVLTINDEGSCVFGGYSGSVDVKLHSTFA